MTTEHEALKLVKRFETFTHSPGDVVLAERYLRTQHALIVQMQQALKSERGSINHHEALAASIKYLKGPKK